MKDHASIPALLALMVLCVWPGPSLAAAQSDGLRNKVGTFSSVINGEVLHANILNVANFSLNDVNVMPTLRNDVLTFSNCHASAYSGTVSGTVVISFVTGHEHCDLELRMEDIDLEELLGDFGANAENYGGKISGNVKLSFPTDDFSKLTGRGQFDLREGSLVELPLIASLVVGEMGSGHGHDEASVAFEVRDRQIKLVHAVIKMPNNGYSDIRGTIGLPNGDLNLTVRPHFGDWIGLGQLPLVGKIIESVFGSATSIGLRMVVRGTIYKPQKLLDPFAQ